MPADPSGSLSPSLPPGFQPELRKPGAATAASTGTATKQRGKEPRRPQQKHPRSPETAAARGENSNPNQESKATAGTDLDPVSFTATSANQKVCRTVHVDANGTIVSDPGSNLGATGAKNTAVVGIGGASLLLGALDVAAARRRGARR